MAEILEKSYITFTGGKTGVHQVVYLGEDTEPKMECDCTGFAVKKSCNHVEATRSIFQEIRATVEVLARNGVVKAIEQYQTN